MTVLLISGTIFLFLLLFIISVYNELIKERLMVREGWSGVGTFLQQRNDVIPNMVEIVKGYAGHENKTLVEVTMWRNRSAQAATPGEQAAADAGLHKSMMDFYTVTEQYPELKANTNFLQLQQDLASLEEKINQSRRYYNGTVREYNQSRSVFPKNMVAGIFGFRDEVFFQEDPNAGQAPKISFS